MEQITTKDGKPLTVGTRVWYRGEPNLGDELWECQTVARIEGELVYFDGRKRVRWLHKDVCFSSRREAQAAPPVED